MRVKLLGNVQNIKKLRILELFKRDHRTLKKYIINQDSNKNKTKNLKEEKTKIILFTEIFNRNST